ncbi:MAG: serine protease [Planctomycetaceae bacterium]|nr:MAG: serine protease [Planctomycetaceae bacterium]
MAGTATTIRWWFLLAVLALAGCDLRPLPAPEDAGVVVLKMEGGHGSGWVFDSNSVITARHVADTNDLLVVVTSDGELYLVVRIVQAVTDAARLYVDRPFAVRPLPVSRHTVRVRDRVEVVGTPKEAANTNAVMPGAVVKVGVHTHTTFSPVYVHYVDAHINCGVSGGPVLYRGAVVGIAVLTNGYWTGFLPVTEFQDILR